MNKKDAEKIVRRRTAPSLFDYCYITTRGHLKSFLVFKQLIKKEHAPLAFLDLGCGYKPFKKILKDINIEKYVGVDFDRNRSAADVESSIDILPFTTDSFDAIIASEVLEHVPHPEDAVKEMRRVAKNGTLVYISTPFVLGEHGTPYDFQRITRFWYREFFREDEILLLRGTNSNLAIPFFVSNVILENIAILKIIPLLPQLWYFINNVMAIFAEVTVRFINIVASIIFMRSRAKVAEIMSIYFYTMPAGLDVIVKIKK